MEARTATRKRLCVLLRRCRTDGRSQALRGRSENRRLHGAWNPLRREREPAGHIADGRRSGERQSAIHPRRRRAVGRLRDLDGRVRVRSEREFGERRAESFGIQL